MTEQETEAAAGSGYAGPAGSRVVYDGVAYAPDSIAIPHMLACENCRNAIRNDFGGCRISSKEWRARVIFEPYTIRCGCYAPVKQPDDARGLGQNVARVSGDAGDCRRQSHAASAEPALLGGASPTGNAGEAAPHCADAKRPHSKSVTVAAPGAGDA